MDENLENIEEEEENLDGFDDSLHELDLDD